jgi:protein SCO1/2
MKRPTLVLVVTFVGALSGLACGRLGQKRYPLKGVIQEMKSSREYVVAHEDIPGFMPAMTMSFQVKAGQSPLQPGDQIEATLVVTDKESWLEGITVKARGLQVVRREGGLQPAGAAGGDLVPDFGLVNQDGQAIKLAQYRGNTLILTFIYTRCPLPEYCPLMMRNFQKLDEGLSADPTLFTKTRLLSISFDTAYDTPEVLRSFGRAFVKDRGQGRFSHWELATGSAEQVKAVAQFFGLVYWGEEGQITHSLCTAIIGPDGKVAMVYRDNQWTVDQAIQEVRRLAP